MIETYVNQLCNWSYVLSAGVDLRFSRGMGGGFSKKNQKFCRIFLSRPNWFSELSQTTKSV